MTRTAIVPVEALNQLAERWEKQAAEHGVRQFTGNDHLLFANELRAAMLNARPQVPDELIEEAAKAMANAALSDPAEFPAMRAAIEAVLGGGV